MTFNGETLLVLAIVAAAAGYLLRGAWITFAGKSRGGCGSCSKCPAEHGGREPQVISAESLLTPPAKRAR
jgi:hypothetical protein